MTRQRAIATPPGQPTEYVDLTASEELVRNQEEADWLASAPDRLAIRNDPSNNEIIDRLLEVVGSDSILNDLKTRRKAAKTARNKVWR